MKCDPPIEGRTRAREVFTEALDRSDLLERTNFVAAACGSDDALRSRVEAMLLDHALSDGFMSVPAVVAPPVGDGEATVGTIGRYRLLRRIGDGGMGTVYLAEQAEPVRRQVAVKVIKWGMDTRQVVARFEAERQALAMMDHPGIARVLDGGATESGRPYFVMELVDGLPITEFCSRHQLPIAERLHLLIQVCQAIQSAHQKGVIHRDLKPSNILISRHEGVAAPKIIDFGVAKAMHHRLTEKTLFTSHATLIGTPAYMSPEQAMATTSDIDTRSDIYSLGVLLYEMITGTTPFPEKRLREAAFAEMQRILLHEEPERPSSCQRRSSSLTLPPIAFELDWIAMKCLEKDRNRRYATANDLALDLQHFLNQEPVLAGPPSQFYRFRKLIHRHRGQAAAIAALGVVLIVASVTSTGLAWKAIRAQRSAREEAATARSVQGFLVDQLLGRANPWVRQAAYDPTNRILVDRIATAVEGRFADQPRVEADIRFALGRALNDGHEDFAGAQVQFERAYLLRKRQLGPEHSDTLSAAANLALALHDVGRHREADSLLEESILVARKSSTPPSRGVFEVLRARGVRWVYRGNAAEGLPYLTEALELSDKLGDIDPMLVTWTKVFVAFATDKIGDAPQAETLFLEGIRDSERVYGSGSPWVAMFQKGLGNLLMRQAERRSEAIERLEAAVSILHLTLGSDAVLSLESEALLASALELNGQIEVAAERFVGIHRRLIPQLLREEGRSECRGAAEFFVRNRMFPRAREVYRDLGRACSKTFLNNAYEFDMYLDAIRAVEGPTVAAKVCRDHGRHFLDSPTTALKIAWILRCAGDQEGYEQVLRSSLEATSKARSLDERLAIIEISGLGPFLFDDAQKSRLIAILHEIESELPRLAANQRAVGYRALSHLQLRFAHWEQCLTSLEQADLASASPSPYAELIRAQCLRARQDPAAARRASSKAEALIRNRVPDPVTESEQLLPAWQVYQEILLLRETRALIAGD